MTKWCKINENLRGWVPLEPCWLKMTPPWSLLSARWPRGSIFHWFLKEFWGTKIRQKSMKKWSDFQTPKKTVLSAQEGPKGSKMELQKASQIKLFLGRAETWKSCSRPHAELVFEVWRATKPHFFRDHFRKPSSCCTGTVVSQIFAENDAPESVQNRSKILPKMKQETKWKKHVKSGGGPP